VLVRCSQTVGETKHISMATRLRLPTWAVQ
jgi:hypothetical protein